MEQEVRPVPMKLTLTAMLVEHKERYPARRLVLSEFTAHWRACSTPSGYVPVAGSSNLELVACERDTVEEAMASLLRYLAVRTARQAKEAREEENKRGTITES